MPVSINTHSILSGISTALSASLSESAQAATARLVGCSQPAVCRRSDDLHQWPADDLLRLALHRPVLALAIQEAVGDSRAVGEPTEAPRDLLATMELTAKALQDGQVSPDEAIGLLRLITVKLIPDLRRCAEGVRA